ncbi:MAG: HAD family hydrolase [Blautia sp.]|nr:HAD family hydrolase [Lachnoclostridium sp.]MCM1210082.1 HAD family hydrolase [Blautia sp.]
MKKLYRDYIFDLYGTLVDIRTNEEERALWNKLSLFFGYYGADYTPEALQAAYLALVSAKEKVGKNQVHYAHEAYPEIPIEEVFQELYTDKGVSPSEELIVHTGQMFRVFSTHHVRLYAGAKELLQKLREAGKGVYLLSNAQRIFTEYELRYLQIYDCFDGIMISSDYGVKKPDERFFRLLLEKYQISPQEALMIGNDLDSDIAGAKSVGMDTFYIHSGISPKLKREIDADYFMLHMNLRSLQKRLLLNEAN